MPVDLRFYKAHGPFSTADLAKFSGADLLGAPDRMIADLASPDEAAISDLCFLDKPDLPLSPDAGACLVQPSLAETVSSATVVLATDAPRAAYSQLASRLYTPHAFRPNTDASARFPGAIVSDTAVIGEGTVIEPGSVVGPGVQIGRNCRIGANASVYFALVGDGVQISAGVRIGEDGFGLAVSADGAIAIPHLGRVIIQDGVAIGANTTVDRGMLADTIIGEGTKIDNQCQIAHNVVIGRHVIIAAFGGISGSVTIGDGAMLGGRVGLADHLNIGAGAKLAAGSGHMQDVPAGETWGGLPAKPSRTWLREVAWLSRQVSGGKGKRRG